MPRFDDNDQLIAGYTDPAYEVHARLFMPLSMPDTGFVSWSSVSRRLGVPLSAGTTWAELAAAGAAGVLCHPAEGYFQHDAVQRLVATLAGVVSQGGVRCGRGSGVVAGVDSW